MSDQENLLEDDDDDDRLMEAFWAAMPLKEKLLFAFVARTFSPGELRQFMTRRTWRDASVELPVPDIDDMPSSVSLDKVEAITERRMKKLLSSI